MEFSICIDISRCTACRACQVACKSWNRLKAEQTENRGSHENPPDLSATTWNRIVFMEARMPGEKIEWSFFNDRCRHCEDAPCMDAADSVPGAIIRDNTGAVIFTEKTSQLDYDSIVSECPYDIPRLDEETNRIYKCTMCIDRITNGLKPACVATCSTGALNFGTKKDMLKLAYERIKLLGKDANLYPGEEYNTFWILPEKQERYPIAKAADNRPYRIARNTFLKQLTKKLIGREIPV
ncbi:MAG: 4Fe-4S dicluster domain-containing protein [Desulfobacterales bacterium]